MFPCPGRVVLLAGVVLGTGCSVLETADVGVHNMSFQGLGPPAGVRAESAPAPLPAPPPPGPVGPAPDPPLFSAKLSYGQYFGRMSYKERTDKLSGIRSRFYAPQILGEAEARLEFHPLHMGPYARFEWFYTPHSEEDFKATREIRFQENDLDVIGFATEGGIAIHHPLSRVIDLTTLLGFSFRNHNFRRKDFVVNGVPSPGGSVTEDVRLWGGQIGEEARINFSKHLALELGGDVTLYAARVENSGTLLVDYLRTSGVQLRARGELIFHKGRFEIGVGTRYYYLGVEEETETEYPEIVVLPLNETRWWIHGIRLTIRF